MSAELQHLALRALPLDAQPLASRLMTLGTTRTQYETRFAQDGAYDTSHFSLIQEEMAPERRRVGNQFFEDALRFRLIYKKNQIMTLLTG